MCSGTAQCTILDRHRSESIVRARRAPACQHGGVPVSHHILPRRPPSRPLVACGSSVTATARQWTGPRGSASVKRPGGWRACRATPRPIWRGVRAWAPSSEAQALAHLSTAAPEPVPPLSRITRDLLTSRGGVRGNHRRPAGCGTYPPARRRRATSRFSLGAALLRRRPKGLLPAARQELLDPSKAWWGGRRGRLADRPRYSISVSLGVVPRWYSRVVEVPVRIEVAAGFVAPGASEPPRLQPSWPPGGSRPAHG